LRCSLGGAGESPSRSAPQVYVIDQPLRARRLAGANLTVYLNKAPTKNVAGRLAGGELTMAKHKPKQRPKLSPAAPDVRPQGLSSVSEVRQVQPAEALRIDDQIHLDDLSPLTVKPRTANGLPFGAQARTPAAPLTSAGWMLPPNRRKAARLFGHGPYTLNHERSAGPQGSAVGAERDVRIEDRATSASNSAFRAAARKASTTCAAGGCRRRERSCPDPRRARLAS
jgi:hypothetical protein